MENTKGLNKSPDREEIIQYLNYVVELEKDVFVQEQTIKQLDMKMSELGRAKSFYEPNTSVFDYFKKGVSWSAPGAIIVLFMGGWSAAIISLFILSMIGGIVGIIVAETKHTEKIQNYQRQLELDRIRVNNELKQKGKLSLARDQLYKQHLSTKETLSQAYAVGVIYNKYRSFPAVASFLDYFNSGRCSTFGENRGGDGAYNMYEKEVRMDIIVAKLDQALVKLDSIRDNQWTLYTAISEGNELSKQLVDNATRIALSAEATAKNSAIAAYNAQRSADDINIIKWMQIFKDK